jgi:hypothetical protein
MKWVNPPVAWMLHAGLPRLMEAGAVFPAHQPTGAALEAVVEKLKAVKLTIRNVPRGGEAATGTCIFTGAPATERILVARAY